MPGFVGSLRAAASRIECRGSAEPLHTRPAVRTRLVAGARSPSNRAAAQCPSRRPALASRVIAWHPSATPRSTEHPGDRKQDGALAFI